VLGGGSGVGGGVPDFDDATLADLGEDHGLHWRLICSSDLLVVDDEGAHDGALKDGAADGGAGGEELLVVALHGIAAVEQDTAAELAEGGGGGEEGDVGVDIVGVVGVDAGLYDGFRCVHRSLMAFAAVRGWMHPGRHGVER
jgi:hypothetical protein